MGLIELLPHQVYDPAIDKAMELLKKAELGKGVLVANLKKLQEELEDMKAKACFQATQIKDRGMPIGKGEGEIIKHLAEYYTNFCNGVAYEYAAHRIKLIMQASGVENDG